MATETYAQKVVSDLLKPTSETWLWRGHQASLVKWLSWLLPRGFWVSDALLHIISQVHLTDFPSGPLLF